MHLGEAQKPLAIVAVLALLVLGLLAISPSAGAATTRVLVINTASAKPTVPFAGFDGNPAKVYDINGDGQLEIIAQNDNQWVYVFDSKTGTLLFEARTTFPAGWGARSFNGPEVNVLTEDGRVHLIVGNSAAYITSYVFDPAVSSLTKFIFQKEWERRLNDCHSNPGMDSKPVLADLDRDGRFEIVASTEELGLFALRHNGALYWKTCIGGGNAEPAIGDLTRDGFPEVVFGSDAGVVTVLNGRTGGTVWNYRILNSFNLGSASIPVAPGIGQLDGIGGPDIVVGARDSHDATDWSNDHALLLALKGTGGVLWAKQDPTGNPLTYTRPVIVDTDGDGKNEVYWGDWNTIGHKPPWNEADSWKVTGPAHFYRFDGATGNMAWRQTLGTWWSNKDVPLADVDGDGVQEMLANGPSDAGHDGIWYLDTRTGAKEAFVDVHPWQVARAPVVADLWNTGTTQWVVEVGAPASAGGPGILVYDTGAPYNSAWPHPPYPVLNPTPTTTSPPSGTFGATFTIKAPNEWWQEVYVQHDDARTVVNVEVRINGGSWKAMTLRSWGAWTSSYNSVTGSKVEFRATDEIGATSTSEPFTWMDGTLTKRSVEPSPSPTPTTSASTTSASPTTVTTASTTPPPPTTPTTTSPSPSPTPTTSTPSPTPILGFPATYELGKGINEWWIEVFVKSDDAIAGVDVRLNGGAWQPLELKSWGAWAKSTHTPAGTLVQFRATNTLGATNHSQTYKWLAPPDGSFQVKFEPQAVGNDWWVEVRVTSADPIAKVEANVNDGAWTALSKTSWGTWAKSFFVPNGSSVRFRATNDAGATVVSDPVIWT